MRILASGMEWITQQPGGLNRYFADYLDAWKLRGEEVQALVTMDPKNPIVLPPYVRPVYLSSSNPVTVFRTWREAFSVALKSDKYDVLNPHFAYYAYPLIGMDTDLPIVTNFQGPWAYESHLESHSGSFVESMKFATKKWIEQRVYRHSDHLIVLSRAFQNVLTTDYDIPTERIHIIPAAVDTGRFYPSVDIEQERRKLGLPMDRMVLLTVRRLARRMGLENLIRAMANLRRNFPQILLVIVGGGKLFFELNDLVAELNLHDHVILTNRVSEELLPLYYRVADLTVVPSVALEGFGLTTVESMASGTPVAGTPVGGTEEILSAFSPDMLFAGSTSVDIFHGLTGILDNHARWSSREQVRQHALDHYTWGPVSHKITEVFHMARKGI